MNEIKSLLDKIKLVIKYNSRLNESENNNFNIFKICGVNHYENTHSSIIAEFLKVDGKHGFKDKFLQAFLDVLKFEKIIDLDFNFSFNGVKIYTELVINDGRIDIIITNNEKQALVIENKIYASDQYQQLKRYSEYCQKEFKSNFLLFYLTLFGDEASKKSSKNIEYKQISYSDIIINWLEKCVEISARNAIVRETLIQYINHLKELTGQDMNSQQNDDLIKLLSNKENIHATLLIGENINGVKNHILNKVFLPQLSDVCDELGLINISTECDWVNTSWAGFKIKNPKWKYFKISTEFESKGLRNCIIGFNHIDSKIRYEKTFENLKTLMKKSNSNWAWKDFPEFTNWNSNALISIIDGKMVDIFKREIKQLLEISKNLEM